MQAQELSKEAGPGLRMEKGYQWPVTGSYIVLTAVQGQIWASCVKADCTGDVLGG